MYMTNFTITPVGGSVVGGGTCNAVWRAPLAADGGGISIVHAHAVGLSGTAVVRLIDNGLSGTAQAGTIATLGSVFTNAPNVGSPNGYFLDAGKYVGITIGAGTVFGPFSVAIGYVHGK